MTDVATAEKRQRPPAPRYSVTLQEAADSLGVSRRTVDELQARVDRLSGRAAA